MWVGSSRDTELVWSPDGKLLAECGDVVDGLPTVRIWEADTGKEARMLRIETGKNSPSPGPATHLAWSPDNRQLGVNTRNPQMVVVVDIDTGKTLLVLPEAARVVWSPDGGSLAVPREARSFVDVLDARTWQVQFTLPGCKGVMDRLLAWSPDGRYLTTADEEDSLIRVWDIAQCQPYFLLGAHKSTVNQVSWNPDGKHLLSVAAEDGTVKVWDWAQKKELFTVTGVKRKISAAWSPDGSRLAVFLPNPPQRPKAPMASQPLVSILDSQTGLEVQTLSGSVNWQDKNQQSSNGTTGCIAWSPDGSSLACESIDGSLKSWEVASGSENDIYFTRRVARHCRRPGS